MERSLDFSETVSHGEPARCVDATKRATERVTFEAGFSCFIKYQRKPVQLLFMLSREPQSGDWLIDDIVLK